MEEKMISRRAFLKGLAAGGVTVAAAGVLQACGSSSTAASTAAASTDAATAAVLAAASAAAGAKYIPGTYTGTAQGIGLVTVTMTFDETSITDVQVDVSQETADIGAIHGDELAGKILDSQGTDFDAISGATVTCDAVKEAAGSCIEQALAEGGAAAAAKASTWRDAPEPIPDSEIKETFDVEIGIIGLGHAGLAAYRAAAESGAKVLAVEVQERDAWWTIGHDIGHINSRILAEHGVPKVDEIEFVSNWQLQTHQKSNPSLIMKFARNSGEAIDWYLDAVEPEMKDKLRVTCWPDNEYTIHQLNNGLRYYAGTIQIWEDKWENGEASNNTEYLEVKDFSRCNLEYTEEHYSNASSLFGTRGVQLLTEDGAVKGFIARKSNGDYVRVNTSKGVVLSGGGFGGNKEMRTDLLDGIAKMFTPDEDFAFPYDRDGSSIQMGVWAGGRLESEISTMNVDSMWFAFLIPGVLRLDENGERFQNEAAAGPELNGFYLARARRGKIRAIYDADYRRQLLTGYPAHGVLDYSSEDEINQEAAKFEAAVAAGAEGADGYYCADSLETLADYIGYEGQTKENFLASIEHYNELCANGADTDFCKDPHFLRPIEKAPFYAQVSEPSIGYALVTTGGFVTTNDQQVVDEYYKPIPGLYATGNTCGLRFGPSYVTPISGVSIGMCITLGRELGRHLAEKED